MQITFTLVLSFKQKHMLSLNQLNGFVLLRTVALVCLLFFPVLIFTTLLFPPLPNLGASVGEAVGTLVGFFVGACVGFGVGSGVGGSVGAGVG